MNVKEFLSVVDLKNINQFRVNDELVSLTYINNNLQSYIIDKVEITTKLNPLTTNDIQTIVVSNNVEDVVDYLNTETYLPNNATYISICINIKIKKGLTNV